MNRTPSSGYIDLLPAARRRALVRGYLARLATVAAVLGIALAVISAVLLMPAYTYLVSAERDAAARVARADTALKAAQEGELAKRLAALDEDASAVAAIGDGLSASHIVKEALAVPRSGIVLSSFTYAAPSAARTGLLALSGTAATRNDLRGFQLALSGEPGFAHADLPVSSYAKESSIPFTISITLATSTASRAATSTTP